MQANLEDGVGRVGDRARDPLVGRAAVDERGVHAAVGEDELARAAGKGRCWFEHG